jgi:uncharacterized RDD family membrane protein YckC
VVWGGVGVRFGALLVDAVILVVALFALAFASSAVVDSGSASQSHAVGSAAGIIWWLVALIYHPACWYIFGATPGQKALSLRVVRAATGQDLGLGEVLIRFMIFAVVTVAFPLGVISAVMTSNDPFKRAWHDTVARSIVVQRTWH